MPRLRTFHRASQRSVIIDNPHTFYSTDYRPVRSMCFFSFIDKNSTSRRYSVEEILTHVHVQQNLNITFVCGNIIDGIQVKKVSLTDYIQKCRTMTIVKDKRLSIQFPCKLHCYTIKMNLVFGKIRLIRLIEIEIYGQFKNWEGFRDNSK